MIRVRQSTAAIAVLLLTAAVPATLRAQTDSSADVEVSIFDPLDLPAPTLYRAASGAPGADYWQQRADYQIQATLDTTRTSISGSETIRYQNNSPDALEYVWLQVDQNLYRPGSLGATLNPANSRFGAQAFAGGMNIESATADGQPVDPYIYDTMMRLDLPRPLRSGDAVDLAISWSFQVPEHGSDRMARQGSLYEIAQWFPRMAVYDDVDGWNTDPYLGQGEFYREFGDYEVAITLPAGFVVGATGVLQNPDDVLTDEQRDRLEQADRSDEPVAIIRADEVGSPATRPRTDGTLTWRFRAENVHDFAWAASPRFRWDATHTGDIRCNAFYQPEATAWVTAADMTCFSIEEFGTRWFPYPYPQATSVAGPVGGMEYPMFVMVHAAGAERDVFNTIAHEHGHEWFPMVVSSNERRYAWMDEGFNTFIDAWANDLRYPGTDSRAEARMYYETVRMRGGDLSVMTPPDRIPSTSLASIAYDKPAMVLHLLRDEVIGPEAFDAGFREYIDRWAFKHPTPADFFRTMEDVSGRDLDWFWRGWFFSDQGLDLAIDDVSVDELQGGQSVATITLTHETDLVMPLTLQVSLANGESHDIDLPVEIWFEGGDYRFRVAVPSAIASVTIDPLDVLPDDDPTNDVWRPAGQ